MSATATRLVNDALDYLRAKAQADARTKRHRRTCLVRTSGSWVEGLEPSEKAVEMLLRPLAWEEAPHLVPAGAKYPGCRYFRAALPPEVVAYRNVVSVQGALRFGLDLEVRPHKPSTADTPEERAADPNPLGWGIFAVGENARPVRTSEVWIVLGPNGDGLVPFCWHPGTPAAPVTKRHYGAMVRVAEAEWVDQPLVWRDLYEGEDDILDVTVHLSQN